MMYLNQDLYIKAWNYASQAHLGQKIPGCDIPYLNHIGLVAFESMSAIVNSSQIENHDLLIVCSILHDTIEDTRTTYDDIKVMFSNQVADGVLALTKNKHLISKEEKIIDSLKRIKDQPKEIWMVKLSDRITNLQPPPKFWSNEKIKKYRDEAIVILDELGESSSYLAERLKRKIEDYSKYIE
jgi:GTP diphosphokinase / guanosine-3',5'-bis(diphosphate) 3'-diphosphatase